MPNIFIRMRIIFKETDSLFSLHILFVQNKRHYYAFSEPLLKTFVNKKINNKFKLNYLIKVYLDAFYRRQTRKNRGMNSKIIHRLAQLSLKPQYGFSKEIYLYQIIFVFRSLWFCLTVPSLFWVPSWRETCFIWGKSFLWESGTSNGEWTNGS